MPTTRYVASIPALWVEGLDNMLPSWDFTERLKEPLERGPSAAAFPITSQAQKTAST